VIYITTDFSVLGYRPLGIILYISYNY